MVSLLCMCGLVLEGDAPQTCSRCGMTVTRLAAPIRQLPAADMDALMRNEIGETTGTDPNGW